MLLEAAADGWRTRNAGRLLHEATDLFVRDKLRVLHAGGFGMVTGVHMALLQNLDTGGTRLTAIAARARMTKQSMREVVDKAEALGFVERRPDPEDGRAKLVAFTSDGLELLERLRIAVATAEQHLAAAVGSPFVSRSKRCLAAYVREVGAGPPMPDTDLPSWRTRNVGRILGLAAATFSNDVLRELKAGGFPGMMAVHLALVRNLDTEGTRLTDLAVRARLTKQAMGELVDKAQDLGLVTRRTDPEDRRAKAINFTPAGLHMLELIRTGVAAGETRLAFITSPAFVCELRDNLSTYLATIWPLLEPCRSLQRAA